MSAKEKRVLKLNNLTLEADFLSGEISSLALDGCERVNSRVPLFSVRLRDKNGNAVTFNSHNAKNCHLAENGALYTDFDKALLCVQVHLDAENGEAAWRISATPTDDEYCIEYVDFPAINLPTLKDNDPSKRGGSILYPYNEGVLVSDIDRRESSWLRHADAEYPSKGNFPVFPNMVSSQMLAYLWNDVGLYIGAHDERRGVKELGFYKENGGVTMRFRLFCGVDFGETYKTEYPIVFSTIGGNWESAAERYRAWFEAHLPEGVTKIAQSTSIPDWYADSPLVVTYPVRGAHDTDDMTPNKLYPYTNALPILERLRADCDSRLLVLLMHWEGTAPWAPPYVWPPFGDAENFNDFKQSLHEKGDMLGVYCSGFGYTLQSKLTSYSQADEYASKELWRGMCASATGEIAISNICTDQRSGYDICPASPVGQALLEDAYTPLLSSGLDYVQILDQNHGGGQYFCYSREHSHPPVPGEWMTENMQKTLKKWNSIVPKTLLGCESAAAEPFIGNLLLSDNRFELNYTIGTPVPLYAYIYHEYVRNFMGNQVCCPFPETEDTLPFRLAYSFSIGDCMTLVISENGELASHWGTRDFEHRPSKKKTLTFISNLTNFYKKHAKPYLYSGRMIPAPALDIQTVTFPTKEKGLSVTFPAVFSSAWETSEHSRAMILVNPNEFEVICKVNGEEIRVPALNASIKHL